MLRWRRSPELTALRPLPVSAAPEGGRLLATPPPNATAIVAGERDGEDSAATPGLDPLAAAGRLLDAVDSRAGVEAFSAINPADFGDDAHLSDRWFRCLLPVTRRASEDLHALLVRFPHRVKAATVARALAPVVLPALMTTRDPAMLTDRLRALLGEGPLFPLETIGEAIVTLPHRGFYRAKAQGFAFLASFLMQEHLERFAEGFLPDPQIETHPLVLEFVRSHRDLMTVPALARLADPLPTATRNILRERVERDAQDPYSHVARKVLAHDDVVSGRPEDASLRALPRTSAPPTGPQIRDRPPHVFVGLFGQLRFPEAVLDSLRAKLAGELGRLGGPVSFGLATWREQGRRVLRDTDSVLFAYERLPSELIERLAPLGWTAVSEFAENLPHLSRHIRPVDAQHVPITAEYLAERCGWTGSVAIAGDEEYFGRESAYRTLFKGQSFELNQARMWDRVHALQGLSASAAEATGQDVDLYVLMRADLAFKRGDFGPHARRVLEHASSGAVTLDFDPQAALIEGVGDRFFICRPTAAARLFDGSRILEDIAAWHQPPHGNYRGELCGHVFPGTLLFEQAQPVRRIMHNDIGFEIYRGRYALPELEAVLRRDAAGSPSLVVRRLLEALLTPGG